MKINRYFNRRSLASLIFECIFGILAVFINPLFIFVAMLGAAGAVYYAD